MNPNTTRLIAVLLAVLMTGVVFAPLGAASDATLRSSSSAASSTADVHESLHDETGETELLLVLPDIDEVQRQGGPDAVVDALKTQAERTQEPVIDELERYGAVEVENSFWIRNSVVVTADLDRIDLETLAAVDGVERIEPVLEVPAPEPVEATPGDEPMDDHVTWGLDAINAPSVWEDFGATGEGVRVVVSDTGVYADHPDIELAAEDGWYDAAGSSSTPIDEFGHGTHVSGTVAGGDASGTAIGVAPDVELANVRVCPGSSCDGQAIMESFEWAVETDSDVINFSLGGQPYGSYIEVVYNTMDAGTLVVAGVGNSGEGTAISPAAPWDSIAAGAIDENHVVADFSSGTQMTPDDFPLGPWMDHWPADSYIVPDATTPGVEVYSADSPDGDMCNEGEYCSVSGTSMATPHMTGIAALILSANPDLDPWEVQDLILDSTWKPDDWNPNDAQYYNPDTERDSRYGTGIVDAYEALSQISDPEPPEGAEFDVSITGTNSPVVEGEDLVVDVDVSNVGDASDTQTVELADLDGTTADSASVSLGAGESTSIQLAWSTESGDAGSGSVTVSSDDHSDAATVEVEADEPDPPEEGFVRLGEASAAEGDTATVELDTDVENVAGYQAAISYDSSVFAFVDASGVDLDDPVVNDEDGTVTLSASQASGVDAPTLAELTFEAVGENGDATDLVFDEDFTQLNTEDSIVQPAAYVSGSLTVGGAECEVPGDVDDSGDVTSLDATLTQQYIAGLDPEGFVNPECGDLTEDGDITPADVTAIHQVIVGIWA